MVVGWVGGWVGGCPMSNSPAPPPRGGGAFVGLWVCQKSVVGGSLKSPPPPPHPVVKETPVHFAQSARDGNLRACSSGDASSCLGRGFCGARPIDRRGVVKGPERLEEAVCCRGLNCLVACGGVSAGGPLLPATASAESASPLGPPAAATGKPASSPTVPKGVLGVGALGRREGLL